MDFTWNLGAVTRGRRDREELALVFTGGDFAEGFATVLDTLADQGVPGSFFFTGDFLRNAENEASIRRLITENHYIGPHSDAHLLYCPWDNREKTLVTREEFVADLEKNVDEIIRFGVPRDSITWWIPPYEWYNARIASWAENAGYPLFNFTPGTLSHTDYTEDDAGNYRSCEKIYSSIFEYEAKDPDGLNGFLLLTHVGAGAKRTDKFFNYLGQLISDLKERGYGFQRVDELLTGEDIRIE